MTEQCEATTLLRLRCSRTVETEVNDHGYCGLHAKRERQKGTLDEQLDAWLAAHPRPAAVGRGWLRGRTT